MATMMVAVQASCGYNNIERGPWKRRVLWNVVETGDSETPNGMPTLTLLTLIIRACIIREYLTAKFTSTPSISAHHYHINLYVVVWNLGKGPPMEKHRESTWATWRPACVVYWLIHSMLKLNQLILPITSIKYSYRLRIPAI